MEYHVTSNFKGNLFDHPIISQRDEIEEVHSYAAIAVSTLVEVISNKSTFSSNLTTSNTGENWGDLKRSVSTELFPKIIPILVSFIDNSEKAIKETSNGNKTDISENHHEGTNSYSATPSNFKVFSI